MLVPLRRPNFRRLFAARTISLFGTAFAPTALAFAVIGEHGSPALLGLVIASGMVPRVVLSLVGGVVVDRLPRRAVMIASDVVAAAAQAAAGALLLAHVASWWELAALNAARGGAAAFFGPASQSIVPQTVDANELQAANVLLGFARNGTMIVGTATAGIVVGAWGPGWALVGDSATYVVGIGFLSGISVLPPAVALVRRSMLQEAAEGWRIVASQAWLWTIIVQFAFINAVAMGSLVIVGPYVAAAELGGARSWGLIMSAQAVGLLLGGLLVSRVRTRYPLRTGTWAIFLVALPPIALAAHGDLAVVVCAAVLSGLALEIHSVYWLTTLQQRIPADKLGRVISYDTLGSFVLIPIGTIAVGVLSDTIGRAATLGAAGVVVIVATAAVLVFGLPGRGPQPVDAGSAAVA